MYRTHGLFFAGPSGLIRLGPIFYDRVKCWLAYKFGCHLLPLYPI